MMALGVVALAASVQAATFRWTNSGAIAAAGDTSTDLSSGTVYLFSGNGQSALLAGYVAAITADASSGIDYLTGASGYVGSAGITTGSKPATTTIAGATIESGRVVWEETTSDASRSYFEVLVSGDNIYITDSVSVTVKSVGNSNISFANNESLAAIKQAADGYANGGWYAVPEPTSGLLLALGMVGLALKRKRA